MTTPPATVPFGDALRFWLKLGFISFGGPAGQIAVMHRELVEQKRWISEQRFLHALNYCMLLPGPEAQQLATYIGWLLHRTWGGVVAGVLFVLPSLFILIALSAVYLAYGHVPWVAALFYGIKSAVAAIVLHAMWRIGGKTLRSPRRAPVLWAIASSSFIAIAGLKWPFPLVILAAALVGWLTARVAPGQLAPGGRHGGAKHSGAPHAPALIDDDTPTPPHALFSRARLTRVLLVGALLWALPMALLVAAQGWHGTLTQMAAFFSKAALLTFGGAYAVLPYVYQAAVEQHQWLTGAQMMDGLALGETTPGPLIMVAAFVGHLGAAQEAMRACGAAASCGLIPLWMGAAGAVVASWFTFLPSFIFILAGGPLVESTHGKPHFTAPLVAVTAAVVGVIGSLALFFVAHIAERVPGRGLHLANIDWVALALAALAAFALLRLKWGVLPVIGACALSGLALRWAGYP